MNTISDEAVRESGEKWLAIKPEGAPYYGIRTESGITIAGTSSGLSEKDARRICALHNNELCEADDLIKSLGFDPDRFRTEFGWINYYKLEAAIKHPDEYSGLRLGAVTEREQAGQEGGQRLPCPFCGSDNISDGEILTEASNGKTFSQNHCLNCAAFGPASEALDGPDYGDEKAIAAWNRRALGTPSPAQIPEAEQPDDDQASDVPVWTLIEMAERCGAVKDASDDASFWTITLDGMYALERALRAVDVSVGFANAAPQPSGSAVDAMAALRSIAEGNLGDKPWQANYDRVREIAAAALRIPSPAQVPEGWVHIADVYETGYMDRKIVWADLAAELPDGIHKLYMAAPTPPSADQEQAK